MTDIKTGDRVKVTIEGEVTYAGERWLTIDHTLHVVGDGVGSTIEKIAPPVEVFKPGDVVRAKRNPGYVYGILGGDRYTYLSTPVPSDPILGGVFGPMFPPFTSKNYERVSL